MGFDPHLVRHHDARLEPAPHQGQHARIAHLPGEAIHQALMVDAVEELRQVNVHHRLTSGLQMRLGFGDRRGGAAVAAKTVAARMEGRLEDRLQNLDHGLLRHPVHHVGNAEVPPPAAGFGDGDPTDRTEPVAFPQQRLAKASDEGGAFFSTASTVCPSTPGAPLLRTTCQQRPRQIGEGRCFLQQPA
jgi:hypothetical protein